MYIDTHYVYSRAYSIVYIIAVYVTHVRIIKGTHARQAQHARQRLTALHTHDVYATYISIYTYVY